jgi:acetyltransferase-like isoleucine patch superfamily enzyme
MRSLQISLEKWRNLASILRGRMRAQLLAWRGAAVDGKAHLGTGCRVDRPWCVKIGKRFFAEELTYLKVVADSALLEFGEFVFIGRGSEFDVMEKVSVGDHTVIAPGCFITDHNHGIGAGQRIDQQPCVAKPVAIGRDVWLGAKVIVLAGVEIGDGAVVAANAVVTRNVPPLAVVAGTPAKLLYFRDERSARKAAQ